MESGGRILTTHVGSLPRPERLIALEARRSSGEAFEEAVYEEELAGAVAEVVGRQLDAGIDVVGDGEFGHPMGEDYDYGAWLRYVYERLGGLELVGAAAARPRPSSGEVTLATMSERRDWVAFAGAYGDPRSGARLPAWDPEKPWPVVRGAITYRGQAALARDIANVKAALAAHSLEEGFLNAVGPASCARLPDEHYASDDELLYACAEAMREEYATIVESGLILQIDEPVIADNWDQVSPEPSVEAYRRFAMVRIEALNHALRGLPAERIRFHLCWGSWHGPHSTDLPMADLLEVMLAVHAGQYSFEAANVRHEHEWKLWRAGRLPEGKVLVPGVVSHATNVIEHPALVADRIERFAAAVGPENVIASTDCGLGGRVHPQIAWAKLEALSAGAALASQRLSARR
jgi:5-methyltetrahydropteroyltriglutamate--homocysteine methyltransferase